jgi:prophage regulatory protein
MPDKIHRLPSTLDITGLCRTSLYDALAAKEFPEPVLLGKRAVGWKETDLDAWIASRQKRNATK